MRFTSGLSALSGGKVRSMSEPKVTTEALRALAEMQGLDIGDEALDELLPLVQRTAEAFAALDALNPDQAEPANTFTPVTG